jgi:hypothetical protein
LSHAPIDNIVAALISANADIIKFPKQRSTSSRLLFTHSRTSASRLSYLHGFSSPLKITYWALLSKLLGFTFPFPSFTHYLHGSRALLSTHCLPTSLPTLPRLQRRCKSPEKATSLKLS